MSGGLAGMTFGAEAMFPQGPGLTVNYDTEASSRGHDGGPQAMASSY